MPADLNKVKTVFFVMFENRSFDHMLGHLSLENINPAVDGLKQPMDQYENIYQGDAYYPFQIPADTDLPFDLPHEFDEVDTQLSRSPVNGKFMMNGFVKAYAAKTNVNPNPRCEPMGYFSSGQVPITSFLAQNFCTCDRWFSALPTSTQPNRTMAFCGESPIFKTHFQLISPENNIFQWMTDNGIRWRVYHDGLSFFAFYPGIWKYVLGDNFRDYEYLFSDMQSEPEDQRPQVIIVEPSYQDAPHIGPDHPNDNHAPLAIGWGEDFLRRTYQAVTVNEDVWNNAMMVVYYDEHGGFYDHVPPPLVPYPTTGNPPHLFNSLGPRIPGIVVSPLVEPGSVCHSTLDHTAVLQFLAEKFTPGKPYSPSVENRKNAGIASLSETLTRDTARTAPQAPVDNISATPQPGMASAFEQATNEMMQQEPEKTRQKYPELFQWKDAVTKARMPIR
jgi:phospholipase C